MSETPETSQDEPSPEVIEAFAKQLFRSENPPDVLWDTKLFERMGRSTDGMKVADEEAKADYLRRAREMLLAPAAG